ncbi:MAG TPA: cation transporter [Bacteroidales bacterium]|nr:cation transporter [Bacteroidales bacterium]
MHISRNFEYPSQLEQKFRKAKKLEWITLFYFSSAVFFIILVMGSSQTMKTAWLEDALSLIPPASFLISSRIYVKGSDQNFPYGYHRVISIAFLISAVALTTVGSFLFIDSALTLIKSERPTISTIEVAGHQVWMGYIMILVLLYSTIPSMILGIKKKPLAEDLLEKNLYTDAQMNKADWLSGLSAVAGIIGIGIGWYWADAVAAIIISFDIMHDGFSYLRQAVFDLMNQIPKLIQNKKEDPIFDKIKKEVEKESWIKTSGIRFRQEGHIYFGEVFIVPAREDRLTERMELLKKKLLELNWRVFDVTLTLVKELDPEKAK